MYKYYEKVRKSVISFCKKTQEVYQMYFMAVKKSRNKFWFTAVQRDAKF